jgi:deoxyribodipyrimidine photo-lyase
MTLKMEKASMIRVNMVWIRRDLRLEDNTALDKALNSGLPVLLLFIFDTNILEELSRYDARVSFIHETLLTINESLVKAGSSLLVKKGDPVEVWKELVQLFEINAVHINKDYEPYGIERDDKVEKILLEKGIPLVRSKDHVIFEEKEILKDDKTPYTVFTPFRNRWMQQYDKELKQNSPAGKEGMTNFFKSSFAFPSLKDLGFSKSSVRVRPYDLSVIQEYDKYRDFPADDKTSYLSPHLRFGTVSIRYLVQTAIIKNLTFLGELVWREFFMQILFNYPYVVTGSFRKKYNNIQWRNNETEFEKWCAGETGYPMVDAGMRQLNETGYMHNRVRMVAASFLVKHLLIDWKWGEAYFAQKLLDFELSSNNGNWQWAAGTGCDAAPYFRVFNPETQMKKFDPKAIYVKKWIPEFGRFGYCPPIVEHNFARNRAISTYKAGLKF